MMQFQILEKKKENGISPGLWSKFEASFRCDKQKTQKNVKFLSLYLHMTKPPQNISAEKHRQASPVCIPQCQYIRWTTCIYRRQEIINNDCTDVFQQEQILMIFSKNKKKNSCVENYMYLYQREKTHLLGKPACALQLLWNWRPTLNYSINNFQYISKY